MALTQEQHGILTNWIENNFIPIQSINYNISAYTIHGIFKRLYDKGFYVDEDTITETMTERGYQSKSMSGQTYFNISQKSQALQIYFSSLGNPSKVRPPEWL